MKTQYYKYDDGTDRWVVAVMATIRYDGKTAHLGASIQHNYITIGEVRIDGYDLVAITEAAWNTAYKSAVKARDAKAAREAKHFAQRKHGERFGLVCHYSARTGPEPVHVVRLTATTIVTADESRWSRRTGLMRQRPGVTSWIIPQLTPYSLSAIEAFAGGRKAVDVVAEREIGDD